MSLDDHETMLLAPHFDEIQRLHARGVRGALLVAGRLIPVRPELIAEFFDDVTLLAARVRELMAPHLVVVGIAAGGWFGVGTVEGAR